jgi:hypothetical protein
VADGISNVGLSVEVGVISTGIVGDGDSGLVVINAGQGIAGSQPVSRTISTSAPIMAVKKTV